MFGGFLKKVAILNFLFYKIWGWDYFYDIISKRSNLSLIFL